MVRNRKVLPIVLNLVPIQSIQLEPRNKPRVVPGSQNQSIADVERFFAVFGAGDDAFGLDADDGVETEVDVGSLNSLVEVFMRRQTTAADWLE